ncbi:MAG TPA: hybrid sensor histidine kinase/response regulator [Candidatus Nitrosotenuis sp.]|jgi:CheY-like chemotaxis protein|nr:hybrid sensor histidine kinase/response regulator [Candidatus Nitrosotenuis sp.]
MTKSGGHEEDLVRMALLGSLVPEALVELSGPLAVLTGYAELLREVADDPAAVAEGAEQMSRAARRLSAALARLESLLRGAEGTPAPSVDLARVVAGLLEERGPVFSRSGIRTLVELEDLPPVQGDPARLRLAFLHLVVQAEAAMPRGGTLQVRLSRAAEGVELMVRDSGPGVPQAHLDELLRPFPEVEGRSPLGLAFCLRVARACRGHLSLASPPEGGLEVRLCLPLAEGAPEGAGPAPAPGARRVLVVEDDPLGGELLERLLRRHGIEVRLAREGREGLEFLDRERFDVVLCDLRMPGMGGQEFYEALARRHPRLCRRLIFVTGDLLSPEAEDFMRRSGCPYLLKPFAPSQLVATVEAVACQEAAP